MTPTATADLEQDQLVSTPDNHVLFMCRRADLRLVKTPRYPKYGPAGQKVGEEPGETVAFHEGVLRVPRTGKFKLEDGREIPAADALAWLEGHRFHNDRADGFWRVDPTAPPVSREELDQLMAIVVELDEDKLLAFIAQERDGWGREDLLGSAEKALERVQAIRQAAAAEAAAQAAAGA